MYFFEYIIESFSAIRTNKLRSGLSLIGIVVWITSVVVLIWLGNGMKEKMIKSFSATNNIITIAQGEDYSITPPSGTDNGGWQESYEVREWKKRLFSEDMTETLRTFLNENIKAIVPVYDAINTTTMYDGQSIYATVFPASPDFLVARDLRIRDGIMFSPEMLEEEQWVVILGFGMVASTFSSGSPLGKSISLNGRPFQIIWIFDKTWDYNVDQAVFIPFSLAKKRFGIKNINRIEVSVHDVTDMARTQKQISYVLDKFFPNIASQIYHLETNERFLKEMQKSINSITLFIAGIAGISLFVWGIGIMNVMLVSVTERTREIGIRKAIGATRLDIMIQFLIESGTITCIGGLIAIWLSYLIWYILTQVSSNIGFAIDLKIILFATGFSILMGVIFWLLPAWKAARMKPIDALRFE